MHTIWSTCVQKPETLYTSHSLRFADRFREKYTVPFALPETEKLRILEIGCGPGALTQALSRWYPHATITELDRDTTFITFAKAHAPSIDFIEGNALHLPFPDNSMDVTISYTVMEHIEPTAFLAEQMRVLRPGGICIVMSVRPSRIHKQAPCAAEDTHFTMEIYARMEPYFQASLQTYGVCQYPQNEQQMPFLLQKAGFHSVSIDYLTIHMTPDDPQYDAETAHAMIHAARQNDLDGIAYMPHIAPGVVSEAEMDEMRRLINEKYDKRLALYTAGLPQWGTSVCLTMLLRGVKPLR